MKESQILESIELRKSFLQVSTNRSVVVDLEKFLTTAGHIVARHFSENVTLPLALLLILIYVTQKE